jgi:hypothetical protein
MELCAADMHAFRTWLRDGRLSFRWDKLSLEQRVRIYAFADYHDFPALRRTIMTTLVLDKCGDNAFRRLPTYKFEGYLAQLPPISPLYQWLGTVWAHHIEGYAGSALSLAHRLESKMPEEFRDLVHSIRSNGRPPLTCRCCYHPCDYHERSSEQEWEIRMFHLGSCLELVLMRHNSMSRWSKGHIKARSVYVLQVVQKVLSGTSLCWRDLYAWTLLCSWEYNTSS